MAQNFQFSSFLQIYLAQSGCWTYNRKTDNCYIENQDCLRLTCGDHNMKAKGQKMLTYVFKSNIIICFKKRL